MIHCASCGTDFSPSRHAGLPSDCQCAAIERKAEELNRKPKSVYAGTGQGRLADLLKEHGVQSTPVLVDALATLVFEAIAEQDPSPKMILHEPYRTIANEADLYLRGPI